MNKQIWTIWLANAVVVLGICMISQSARAQERNDVLPNRQPGSVNPNMKAHLQNEAISLEFVHAHHAELEQYLSQLKLNYPAHYRRATAEIAKQANRIQDVKERNPAHYEYLLENWKVDSRIKLLAITNTVHPSAKTQKKLVELVERQMELQHQKILDDRERLKQRLERLNQQIEKYEENPDRYIEQRMFQIQRRATTDVNNAQRGIRSSKQNR